MKTPKPEVVSNPHDLRKINPRKREGLLGFVPTMGALHEGHCSLIEMARKRCQTVVVSIFVNPTQFGPKEDFSRYPRPLEKDLEKCRQAGADVVFTPAVDLIYPPGYCTTVEVANLQEGLCGASRPGHFRGVATVVLKLFNLVQPDLAFFGQKDAQQVRIIEQMVEDLNLPLVIVVGPTVRADDGLALSSRNQYLDPDQRRHAPVLYQSLRDSAQRIRNGERDVAKLVANMTERISATPGALIDYIEVVDARSLKPVTKITGKTLIAMAVRFGSTRLIDNIIVEP